MIQKAQEKIFLSVQAESFANEIKQLKSEKKMVPESNSISQLDPFLDSRALMGWGEIEKIKFDWRRKSSCHSSKEMYSV